LSRGKYRAARLSNKVEFDYVFAQSRKYYFDKVLARWASGINPRLGCIVSKQYGNQVRRHQFKRRARAAFQKYYQCLPPVDIILTARPGKGWATYDELENIFRHIINKGNGFS